MFIDIILLCRDLISGVLDEEISNLSSLQSINNIKKNTKHRKPIAVAILISSYDNSSASLNRDKHSVWKSET